MLIKSVHIVNDAEGIIQRAVTSLVRLEFVDSVADVRIRNSLYVSVITGRFVFRRSALKDGELDSVLVVAPVSETGEMPSDMVQARPKMMNDLAAQNPETDRDKQVMMIIGRCLPLLIIWIGENWVFAATEEADDLTVEIDDVLVGPL